MSAEQEKIYYVYAYYLKSTNHIFHIGKGKNDRYKKTTKSRNDYFRNKIKVHGDDVAVKKLYENLTEDEAFALERKLIAEYKALGQCETNFHEGGQGGNTGNYNNPERSRKLSESAKKRTGEKNPNYGNHWSEEQKRAMSEKIKAIWTPEKRAEQSAKLKGKPGWNKGLTKETDPRIVGKSIPMTPERYAAMMDRECPYLYRVFLNDELVFENISSTKMEKFCSEELGISRTIIEKVLAKKWTPTFKRHAHLTNLRIERIDRKCID